MGDEMIITSENYTYTYEPSEDIIRFTDGSWSGSIMLARTKAGGVVVYDWSPMLDYEIVEALQAAGIFISDELLRP